MLVYLGSNFLVQIFRNMENSHFFLFGEGIASILLKICKSCGGIKRELDKDGLK